MNGVVGNNAKGKGSDTETQIFIYFSMKAKNVTGLESRRVVSRG